MSIDDPRAELVSLLPRLRRFAYGLTGNGQAADDLVQAGCLKAIERCHPWQPDTHLASWMFRILQTTWVDNDHTQQQPTDHNGKALDALIGADGRVAVEARNDARVVRELIAQLPEEQRTVLMMITIDGLSYKEVAQVLEVPIGTVMSRLAQARGKLADAIGTGG